MVSWLVPIAIIIQYSSQCEYCRTLSKFKYGPLEETVSGDSLLIGYISRNRKQPDFFRSLDHPHYTAATMGFGKLGKVCNLF